MILYMYVASGQSKGPLGGEILMSTLRSFVTKLKKKFSLKSDCIHIFHDFIHVYVRRKVRIGTIPKLS